MYASGRLLRETFGDTTLDFFYSNSGQPYALSHNGTTYYYITNVQGDVMSIVDGTGAVVAEYEYDPYGNIISATGALAEVNPLRYRGYVYDQECNLYYLQSRYYDPGMGRFINADAYASTGQGILGYNMFAYCGNNPIGFVDTTGTKKNSSYEDDEGTRCVGVGVQVNIDAGYGTMGFEIILYWDPSVCGNGKWTVAVYTYGGISVETYDAWIGAIVGIITDNADLLMADAENNINLVVQLIACALGNGYSFSISGLAVFGYEDFKSTKSYEKSFTSVNVGFSKARASVAYSDSGFAVSLGYNCIGGYKLFPSWGISKTYYKLEKQFSIPALFE